MKRQHDWFPDAPFVPDVFTGAQSPHVDHDVLTRLDVQRSLELKVTTRKLFNEGLESVSLMVTFEERKEMFYLMMHSTHFYLQLYCVGYIVKDHLFSERKNHCCQYISYSFRLAVRVLLYAPSHRWDSTYHSLCYSCGALDGMRLHWCQKNPMKRF